MTNNNEVRFRVTGDLHWTGTWLKAEAASKQYEVGRDNEGNTEVNEV